MSNLLIYMNQVDLEVFQISVNIGIIVALLQSASTVLLTKLVSQIRSSSAIPWSPNALLHYLVKYN